MEAIQVNDFPVSFAVSPWKDYDKNGNRIWISMAIHGASVYGNISTEKAKVLIAALSAVIEHNETVEA